MYKNARGFSDDQLLRIAPSVGASHAHESRSGQYGYVPTLDIVQGLREEGFVVTGAMQARTRDEGKTAYTKHLLEFTHVDDLALYQRRTVGDLFMQYLLTNSHAGETSFHLDRGVYRLACSNGLIVPESVIQSIRLQHRRTLVTEVVESVLQLAQNSGQVMEHIQAMKRVHLSLPERVAFGRASLALRWPEVVEAGEGSGAIPTAEQVIEPDPYRIEDHRNDLFTTFNVVQERLVKGGVRTYDRKFQRHTTREVKSITGLTTLNKGLWLLAEEMRKIKANA